MGRHVLGALATTIASDPGDPILNAAILVWNSVQVPWTDAWFQFPIFHPTPNALTFSEHLLGVSVIATPIYWMTGNALTAYNVTLLLSYPLSGLAMFLLVRRLTGSSAAAFLSGLAFAFAPYRASQLPHIQVLFSFWAPLALLGLHGFIEAGQVRLKPDTTNDVRSVRLQADRRWWWLALFAVCWMLQGAANGYFLVFFTVLIGLWVLWFLAARGRWRDVGLVAAAAAIAVVPLAPILYRYLTAQRALGLSRNLAEIATFGADIAAPLCAPPSLTFWGWLRVACVQEGELFPGAALVALCTAGAIWAGRAGRAGGAGGEDEGRARIVTRRAAIGVALVFMAIAVSVFVIGPWRIELGWLRASASAADKPMSTAIALLLVAFLLSRPWRRMLHRGSAATFYLLAAVVCWVFSWGPFPRLFGTDALYQAPFAWLLQLPGVGGLRVPARFWMMSVICLVIFMGYAMAALLSRFSRRQSFAVVALAACGLVADGVMTIPAAEMPRGVAAGDALRGDTVLILPVGDRQRDTRAVYDAVAGGWRSINGFSGYEPAHYEALRTLSQAGDEQAVVEPFRERGDVTVINEGSAEQVPLRRSDVTRPVILLGERLIATGLTASCSPEGVGLAIDGDLSTRWVCGTQTADQQITVDLGRVASAGAIVHALGSVGADFPRELIVETSIDGSAWQPAWQGSPAAAVLRAALESPVSIRAAVVFPPRPARYVRLRQIGRHDVNYWSMAELEVWSGE